MSKKNNEKRKVHDESINAQTAAREQKEIHLLH